MNEHFRVRKDRSRLGATWRLPIKDEHYVRVYVWQDEEAMIANVLPGGDPNWEGGKYAACYLAMDSIEVDGERLIPVFYGEMHLVQKRFGVGVIAHEITHCLLNWIRDHEDIEDEEVCVIAGEMNRKFWNSFYRRYKQE